MPDKNTPFVRFSAAQITKVEEQVLPGILDLRIKDGVWEKLVHVRRDIWAGESRQIETAAAWRPVVVVVARPKT